MAVKKGEMDRLRRENEDLRKIAVDLQWAAKRYASGRSTYAPSMINDATRKMLELGIEVRPGAEGTIWAAHGAGRIGDDLTDEHLEPGHPVAMGQCLPLPPHIRLHEALEDLFPSMRGRPYDIIAAITLAIKERDLFFEQLKALMHSEPSVEGDDPAWYWKKTAAELRGMLHTKEEFYSRHWWELMGRIRALESALHERGGE